jgi:hypothetical protein
MDFRLSDERRALRDTVVSFRDGRSDVAGRMGGATKVVSG